MTAVYGLLALAFIMLLSIWIVQQRDARTVMDWSRTIERHILDLERQIRELQS